jgi:hypothetical protein
MLCSKASCVAGGLPMLPGMNIGTQPHLKRATGDRRPARPELADIGRLTRRFIVRTLAKARAEEDSVSHLLASHLGGDADGLPVAEGSWRSFDRVNVQTGLDAWLAQPGRAHKLVGLSGHRHSDFGLADLLSGTSSHWGIGTGSLATEALPSGPGGQTRPCVQCGLYLIKDAGGAAALLLRATDDYSRSGPNLEVVTAGPDRATEIVADIRRLAIEHNVFRGHVIAFGGEMFGADDDSPLTFLDRPPISRDQVILPDAILDGIERQVVGIARYGRRLLASGQHLRRGILLYGVPGTGKTHTVRYLLGKLHGVTCIIVSGGALRYIAAACSVARVLQPALIVVEDVDLIAQDRDMDDSNALLFQLLNEMDGIGNDIDVTFLLTTNRADLLEQALAARPGRVDHAAELPIPSAEARSRLIRLYQGRLDLRLSDEDAIIARTEGVTASFIKEMLRRAALLAAEQDEAADDETAVGAQAGGPAAARLGTAMPIRVADEHMMAALDQLLDTRNALTQVLLGGGPSAGARAENAST